MIGYCSVLKMFMNVGVWHIYPTLFPAIYCCCSVTSILLTIHLSLVNCSDPTPPMDGSIDPYQNTTEGAVISFRCDPGLVPAGRMNTICESDGRWIPDPATTVCTCKFRKIRVYIYRILPLKLCMIHTRYILCIS